MAIYRLTTMAELPQGEGRTFEVAGRRIAVFRTRTDQLFATQADCPHKLGPLADGLLGGLVLVCPLHEWRFDLGSGDCLNQPCKIDVFAASRNSADEVHVELPDL